jgi:UDP-3-O-[3-hydroxymyristoyl] glucosamine N-acyltransferase
MKVEEIAKLVNGHVVGDRDRVVKGVAGLESAGAEDITFAEGERAVKSAARSNAGCILVPTGALVAGKTTIAVSHPKLALIRTAEALLPERRQESGVHPTAIVEPAANLSEDVTVGPHAVIENGVTVGARTSVGTRVHLGRDVQIGADSVLYPGATIYSGVHIGSRVVIHAGAVIGADGFGYVFAEGRHQKFPQLGQVLIEDDVEIGANTTIDRGSLGNTIIGQGTKIDNLVQIAHNVRIGRHCVIAAQTGISGSVEIGNHVMIGGQVGIGDKVRIEDQVIIGAQAGVPSGKILRRGSAVWGTPARPISEFKKSYAQIANLPRLARKVDEIAELVAAKSKRR